jgi:hypothetical protein
MASTNSNANLSKITLGKGMRIKVYFEDDHVQYYEVKQAVTVLNLLQMAADERQIAVVAYDY